MKITQTWKSVEIVVVESLSGRIRDVVRTACDEIVLLHNVLWMWYGRIEAWIGRSEDKIVVVLAYWHRIMIAVQSFLPTLGFLYAPAAMILRRWRSYHDKYYPNTNKFRHDCTTYVWTRLSLLIAIMKTLLWPHHDLTAIITVVPRTSDSVIVLLESVLQS